MDHGGMQYEERGVAGEHPDKRGLTPQGWSSIPGVKVVAGGRGRPVALVIAVLLAIWYILPGEPYWRHLHQKVFDAYQRAFPRQNERLRVIIVDIDEASLTALGQWPWPRTRLARLIDATHRLGASAIGLDLLMPEADRFSPDMVLAERSDVSSALREALASLPSNDRLLADTLRRTPTVLGRAGLAESGTGHLPGSNQTAVRVDGEVPMTQAPAYTGHLTNVPELEAAAIGRGYLNSTPDADGVLRHMPLLMTVQGTWAPALALEVLRVAIQEPVYTIHGGPHGIRGVQVGESFLPTDPDGHFRLYFSPPDPRRRVSALTVLQGTVDARALANSVALIGVTAVGVTDITMTPVTTRMDGVEVQAQVVENMLAGTRLLRPSLAPWWEGGAFLWTAALLITLLPQVRPGYSVIVFVMVTAVLAAVSLALFIQARILLDPSFPTAGNLVVLFVLLTAGLAASDRARRDMQTELEAERLERIRVAGELRAAHDIQMGMLPSPETIASLPAHLAVHALLEPAREVGGDLYDAFMLDEQHFFFSVADVSGKGVPASLFMALSKALCKSIALREHVPLDALMILMNREISRENHAELFVTAVIGILDTCTGSIELCCAGHEAPILLRPGEAPRSLEVTGGPPFCFLEDFPYPSVRMVLQPGDMLVMITDGVTEAQDPGHHLYGIERTLAYLATIHTAPYRDLSVASVCQGLYADVCRFAAGADPADDVTIMAICFAGPASTPPRA
jgi:CHASE2 domain-containing sensor protein/serine phosphatase RsbU (regulator of sigma subunit)